MANWGYRVYEFEMKKSNGEVLAHDVEAHRELLRDLLLRVGEETRLGAPRVKRLSLDSAEENSTGGRLELVAGDTLSVRGAAYDSELAVVHASVALGEKGLHDFAVLPEDRSDILAVHDRAAETPRRVDFYFSESGDRGFLVAEYTGLRDPVKLLLQWVNYLSRMRRSELKKQVETEPKHVDENGNEISKARALQNIPYSVRVSATRVSDPSLLKALIADATSMEAKFLEKDASNRVTERSLEVKVRDHSVMRRILDRLKSWKPADNDTLIYETLEELELDPDSLDDANLSIGTFQATITDGDGVSKTLAPGRISDLFSYPFPNPVRPTSEVYYSMTSRKLDQLKVPASIAFKGYGDSSDLANWVDREETRWNEALTQID